MTRLALPALALLALAWPHAAAAAPCEVTGTVRDADGQPVVGVAVRLEQTPQPKRSQPPTATTDTEGNFRFSGRHSRGEVIASLHDTTSLWFSILEGGGAVELRATLAPDTSCQISIGPDAHPRGADLLALYQGLRRGFLLFERLGIRRGTTLRVEASDPVASEGDAYWIGTWSFNASDVQPPRLVLGTAATLRTDSGAPDDREYHELGHHALATAFGALPRARDHLEGGGYHRDTTSTAAWTEGFAIFFAALVAREIEARPDAGRHRVEGAWLDLELDHRPWDLRGTEELAVASLLWDMVDGDRDDRPAPLEVDAPEILADAGVPHLFVARVKNPSATPVRHAYVRVQGAGFTAAAPVAPAVLASGSEGWVALPVPATVAEAGGASLKVTALATPGAKDDDAVEVEPKALWAAIAEFRSVQPEANGRLFDVADLYQALRGRFGEQDRDRDGLDDIDALFLAHGLFADLDGDREHDPAEALGSTAHPGRTLTVDGDPQTWPDLRKRRRLALPQVLRMSLEVEPADAHLAVLVSGSAFGGYLATPDADGSIRVLPPPAKDGATVSVLALAPGHRPTVLWHQDARTLLDELEQHDVAYLEVAAKLPTGSGSEAAAGSSGGGATTWHRPTFVGGAVAALVGLLLMAIGWPRLR